MMQCLDALKHFSIFILTCCDSDLHHHSRGLPNPKDLAKGTVCMYSSPPPFFFPFLTSQLKSYSYIQIAVTVNEIEALYEMFKSISKAGLIDKVCHKLPSSLSSSYTLSIRILSNYAGTVSVGTL